MIALAHPELLLALGIPWALVFYRFARVQTQAVGWIEGRAAPRFRHRLTRYTAAGLGVHLTLLCLLGALLVVAAAGPTLPGEAEVRDDAGGRVVLLLDSSASMRAEDPVVGVGEPGGAPDRFARAQGIALELVGRLEGHRFAVVGFSGVATYLLPMTADRELVLDAVATSEIHTFYRRTGSSFGQALDAALHFAREEGAGAGQPNLQVVVLSDGEAPRDEDADYDAPLAALAESGVPVHSIAVGSAEGEGRLIYDMRDVVAEVEEPRVLVEFHTRREERHLRRMARRTGGRFQVDGPGVVDGLVEEIRRHRAPARVEDPRARRDLSPWLLGLFLVVFVADALVFDRRRPRGPSFELDRLGPPTGRAVSLLLAALLLLPAAGCGDSPARRAHRENERGIALDLVARHEAARPHYVRSIGHGVESEIPTYNLGRSRTLAESWSEAHDLYQQALDLDPDLRHALYNDGVALYRWGDAERDPRGCQLQRTRELWRASLGRFATVRERSGALAIEAAANERHVAEALAVIEDLIANPPPECLEPPPQPPEPEEEQQEGGGGGGGGEDGGGGAGGSGGAPPPLTEEEQESVRQAQRRIEEQRRQEGKYFRRSAAEQFPAESWQEPDAEIWW